MRPRRRRTTRAVSLVYDVLGDFSRALDHQFRALAINQRTGDESSKAATLRTIGVVYSRSGDPQAGLDFYRRSLALCRLPQDALDRAKTLDNIGINRKNLGQYADARAALAELHEAKGNPTAALDHFSVSMRSNAKCSRKPPATSCAHCRFSFRLPPRGARPSSSASDRRR